MRSVSIALACCIFMLNILPAMDSSGLKAVLSDCPESCGITDSQERPAEQDGDDCDDICNPFMSCNTCFGFTISSSGIIAEPMVEIVELDKFYRQAASVTHSHSVWHPPRLS